MKKILIVLAVSISCLGTVVQAQLTNNPYAVNVTNTAALASIGSDGFGVAVLGYPMPAPKTNFFANQLDGVAVSDGSVASDQAGMLQFYIANEDNLIGGGIDNYNLVAHRVLQSISNPNQFTVTRSFIASIQTNAPISNTSDANALYGEGCVGTFGLGGVSSNGTVVFRMDGTSAPASGQAGEGTAIISAYLPSTIIITDTVSIVDNNVSGIKVLAIDSNSGNIPQIGQSGLVVKNSFGGFSFVARPDINPGNAGTITFSTNGQAIVCVPGTTAAGSAVAGFYAPSTWATRGVMAVNESAKTLATYIKTAQDIATGGDAITGVAVIKYTDSGSGPLSPTSLQTNIFGASATGNFPTGGTSTNGQYFFSRAPFAGPSQISINDSGAVAFAVSINIDAANDATNGTRAAQVTGIILQPAGAAGFRFVTDNTNPSLFYVPPVSCTNKNLISAPSLDNYNNVYFEASYANNTNFPCDLFPSNAVYEAVANNAANPTSWTTRILLRQGDTFVNPVTGDNIKVLTLPYNAGPGTRTVSQRAMGPNAINRTQLPGHTIANTTPGSAFAFGGIVVQATITNLTQAFRSDALLYIGPYTSGGCTALPFLVTAVSRSGNNFNITYNAQTGTNIVQALAGGNYSSSGFVDLPASTNIVTGCPASANFTDVGGVTSSNGYYRVRLIQP